MVFRSTWPALPLLLAGCTVAPVDSIEEGEGESPSLATRAAELRKGGGAVKATPEVERLLREFPIWRVYLTEPERANWREGFDGYQRAEDTDRASMLVAIKLGTSRSPRNGSRSPWGSTGAMEMTTSSRSFRVASSTTSLCSPSGLLSMTTPSAMSRLRSCPGAEAL